MQRVVQTKAYLLATGRHRQVERGFLLVCYHKCERNSTSADDLDSEPIGV